MSALPSELPSHASELVLPSLGGYISEPGALLGVSFWPCAAARIIDMLTHSLVRCGSGWLFGAMLLVASRGHIRGLVIFKLRHPGLIGFIFGILGLVGLPSDYDYDSRKHLRQKIAFHRGRAGNATPCRLNSAIIRELGYLVDSLFFGLIAYTAMQNTEKEQRHGDEWAQTVVCRRDAVLPQNLRGNDRFVLALIFALMANATLGLLCLLVLISS